MAARGTGDATDDALDGVGRRAIRDILPLHLPTIPFALVLGVAMTESVMPTPVAWSTMSSSPAPPSWRR